MENFITNLESELVKQNYTEEVIDNYISIFNNSLKYETTLTNLLSTLTPRENKIISMILGIDNAKLGDEQEIAKMFNTQVNRIKLIENKAIRRLVNPKRIKKFIKSKEMENNNELYWQQTINYWKLFKEL